MDPIVTVTIILLAVGAVLAIATIVEASGAAGLRLRLRRRRLLIVLKTGETLRGVLWRQPIRHLELRNAELLEGDAAIKIDGAVLLARNDVLWIQNPDGGT